MPQEIRVVRCGDCETFQSDIVKKVPKWICKVCKTKQSLIKVYFIGSGKECRQVTQELNYQRSKTRHNSTNSVNNNETSNVAMTDYSNIDPIDEVSSLGISKWGGFMPKENESVESNNIGVLLGSSDKSNLEIIDKGENCPNNKHSLFVGPQKGGGTKEMEDYHNFSSEALNSCKKMKFDSSDVLQMENSIFEDNDDLTNLLKI